MCRAPCPHARSSKLRPTPPQRDIDCATIPWRIARPTPCPVHLWPTLATDRRRRDGELVSAALVCYVYTLAYFSPKKGCSRSPGAIRLLAVWSHGPVVQIMALTTKFPNSIHFKALPLDIVEDL